MATKPKSAGPATKGLSITARAASFRRAGFEFGHETRVIPLSELTEDQHEALTTEPMLVCHEVDVKAEKA